MWTWPYPQHGIRLYPELEQEPQTEQPFLEVFGEGWVQRLLD